MAGSNDILLTVGKILLAAILITGLSTCGDAEEAEVHETESTITREIESTATNIPATPTLKPAATATKEATPTIRLSPTVEISATPEMITAVEITVGAANLRSGPGIEATIIGVVSAEAYLELIEISEGGQWYKVKSEDGNIGWVGSSVASIVEVESPQRDQGDEEEVEPDETPTLDDADGTRVVPDLG